MKRVFKLLIVLGLVLLVVIVAGALLVNRVARTGIQSGATYALGVDTTLQEIQLGIISGHSSMQKLNVANPEGFSDDPFLTLGDLKLQLDMASLTSDTINVPTFEISDVGVSIEHIQGKANYDVILENLNRFAGEEDPAAEPAESAPEDEAPGKQLDIQRIVIRNVNVQVAYSPIEGDPAKVNTTIPEILIENPGKLSTPELAMVITTSILASSVKATAGQLPGAVMSGLESGLGKLESVSATISGLGDQLSNITEGVKLEKLGEGAGELGQGVSDLGEGAGEAANQASEAAEEAGDAVKESTEGLGQAVEGLFGQEKKENQE